MLKPTVIAALLLALAWPGAQPPPDPAAFHSDLLVMDAHVHMINRQFYLGGQIGDRQSDGQVDLPRLNEGGVDAFFFSLSASDAYYPGRFEVKHTLQLMELARQQLEAHSDQIEMALTGADVERITAAGKMAAILDLEGNFDLDGDLLLLRLLHRLGLRSAMIPAHNTANNFADSCCDDERWGGLNDHGRALIREMNRLGMVVNIAHGSNETILQAVETSQDPVIFSHGGFRHFVDTPRSLTDEAARAIASKGGVIGIHFGNAFNNPVYWKWRRQQSGARLTRDVLKPRTPPPPVTSTLELDKRLAQHYPIEPVMGPVDLMMEMDQILKVIDYAVGLVGEDHVALGIDFDGAVEPPKGIRDASDYPKITAALLDHGYSQERVRKIMGQNLLRLFKQVAD